MILRRLDNNEHIEAMYIMWKLTLDESEKIFNDMGLMKALGIVTITLYVLDTSYRYRMTLIDQGWIL